MRLFVALPVENCLNLDVLNLQIKRYPRTVESSLRRADDKRKRQRESAKERKEAEKAKKREEIQRLKALKRQEIMEKIKQLEQITGNPELAGKIDEADIEGDFDPEEHDRRMQKLFGEEYYGEGEEEKPVFPYDEELDEGKAYTDLKLSILCTQLKHYCSIKQFQSGRPIALMKTWTKMRNRRNLVQIKPAEQKLARNKMNLKINRHPTPNIEV